MKDLGRPAYTLTLDPPGTARVSKPKRPRIYHHLGRWRCTQVPRMSLKGPRNQEERNRRRVVNYKAAHWCAWANGEVSKPPLREESLGMPGIAREVRSSE